MFEKPQLNNIDMGEIIGAVNGKIDAAFDDILDRNENTGKRIITLKIELKPEMDNSGRIDRVGMKSHTAIKTPGDEGLETCAFIEAGRVVVNAGDPLEPVKEQTTIHSIGGGE